MGERLETINVDAVLGKSLGVMRDEMRETAIEHDRAGMTCFARVQLE